MGIAHTSFYPISLYDTYNLLKSFDKYVNIIGVEVDTDLVQKEDFELFTVNFISYKTFGDWYIKFIKSQSYVIWVMI